MKAVAAATAKTTEVEDLQNTIRQQKGQLALALGVLMSLGFDLDLFLAI